MWLDNLIGFFSPESELRRVSARAAVTQTRNYEAAKISRRTENWFTAKDSARDAPSSRLRERARDLVRNNPYAKKALRVLADNCIGGGITPQARSPSENLNKQIMNAFDNWVEFCDLEGDLNFYALQSLIIKTVIMSGECLVRIYTAGNEGVPLKLQVLEPDHLDTSRNEKHIQSGIEFNERGERVAYWLSDLENNGKSFRVSADEILHIYEKDRPGQIRGVTSFAASILKLKDLDDYNDAEIWRKKIEACFAAFVIQNNGIDGPFLGSRSSSSKEPRLETFRPGMIEYLKPGEDVRFGTPQSDSNFESYQRTQLHAIAAGIGITYEQLTGDLSQVNYSSLRAGLLEFRRMIEVLRWQVFIPSFCSKVWRKFIDVAYIRGLIDKVDYSVSWTPPKFEMIDPVKDAEADTLMMRNGTLTLKDAIANRGFDPDVHIAEIAKINEQLDQHNIILDSDPRHDKRN